MKTLRRLVNNHPIIAFFLVACIYSWTLWGLMMASAYHWLPINFPTTWIGSFGPSLAAIVIAAVSAGVSGVRDLLRPLLRWRFGLRWYLFVLAGCLLPFAVAYVAFVLSGGIVPPANFPLESVLVQLPVYFFVVLILGGPLGEEIGWRGFALPRLLERHNTVMASLLLTVIWYVWHLPLFWLPGAAQAGTSIVAFAVFVLGFSLLFTWVYQHTAGSLLAALLMHTTINTLSVAMSGLTPGLEGDPWFVAYAGLAALVVAGIAIWLGKPTTQEPAAQFRPPAVRPV